MTKPVKEIYKSYGFVGNDDRILECTIEGDIEFVKAVNIDKLARYIEDGIENNHVAKYYGTEYDIIGLRYRLCNESSKGRSFKTCGCFLTAELKRLDVYGFLEMKVYMPCLYTDYDMEDCLLENMKQLYLFLAEDSGYANDSKIIRSHSN